MTQSSREKIYTYATINHPLELNNPILSLINGYEDIINILSLNNLEITKFIYFNKMKIHQILYESEELIKINENVIKLKELFYLSLLINENSNIINYIYSLQYIIIINNYQKNNNNIILKNILFAKIIIELIFNYRQADDYEENNEIEIEKLNKIEKDNKMIIADNINILQQLDINLNEKDFYSIKIDEMYMVIITSIIKNNKFDNSEYIDNIFEQLELEYINITKTMFEQLLMELNMNNVYINEYMITTVGDLTNIKKINFYYFLLKYVLKDPFYIYNIPFFLRTKIIFLNILKNNTNDLLTLKIGDELLNSKIEFIFKSILDSEYYFTIYKNLPQLKSLENILEYYKFFLFESKMEEITEIENIFKTKNIKYESMNNILKDLENAKKMNIRKPIINYLFNIKLKNGQYYDKNEKEINKESEEWMDLEKRIKEKKIKNIKKNTKIDLVQYFIDINNKDTLLQIFEENIIGYFILENKEKINLKKIESVKANESKNIDFNPDLTTKAKNSTKISSKLIIKLILIIYS